MPVCLHPTKISVGNRRSPTLDGSALCPGFVKNETLVLCFFAAIIRRTADIPPVIRPKYLVNTGTSIEAVDYPECGELTVIDMSWPTEDQRGQLAKSPQTPEIIF